VSPEFPYVSASSNFHTKSLTDSRTQSDPHTSASRQCFLNWREQRFRGPILAVEFSNRLWRVSTAEIPQHRRRVNRGRLPSPILLPSDVAAWAALPETCFSTKQSRSVSRATRPGIRKPGRGRRQRPRPRVRSLPLRFQLIHPREPVLPRNVDLLRRNAIYAGSPAASATGIARPR
jgi:hypothetical protein